MYSLLMPPLPPWLWNEANLGHGGRFFSDLSWYEVMILLYRWIRWNKYADMGGLKLKINTYSDVI